MFTAVAHKNLAHYIHYAAGEIRPGQWLEAVADRLGLTEQVTRDQFYTFFETQHPTVTELDRKHRAFVADNVALIFKPSGRRKLAMFFKS